MAGPSAPTSLRRMQSDIFIFFALQAAAVVGLVAIMATIHFGSAPSDLGD